MNLQTFTYREGCWYLAFVGALFFGLTLVPDDSTARLIIGCLGMATVVAVGALVETFGIPE